jgi:hypothetical protein
MAIALVFWAMGPSDAPRRVVPAGGVQAAGASLLSSFDRASTPAGAGWGFPLRLNRVGVEIGVAVAAVVAAGCFGAAGTAMAFAASFAILVMLFGGPRPGVAHHAMPARASCAAHAERGPIGQGIVPR